MDKWQKYLYESRKRGSGAGLEKSLKWFLDHGPQKKGGYKNKRPRFSRKKFNDISAPPGAPGGGALEEEVEEETFEMNSTLHPKFWDGMTIDSKIIDRLIAIAQDFLDGLEVPVEMEDLRLTGSLANYNWSKYSDVDLHLVVDFSKIDEDEELVKAYFDAARARWNDTRDIKIKGHEVEIYVENSGEEHVSSGIYSILNGEWVTEPVYRDVDIDFVTARKKSDSIETRVNLIPYQMQAGDYEGVLRTIDRLKSKIRRMRQAGLDSPQREFSPENIAFKILRRSEVLKKLNDLKYDAYDTMMSIEERRNREI